MNPKVEKSLNFISHHLNDKWSFTCYLSQKRDLVSNLESPKEIWSALIVLELLHDYLSKEDVSRIIDYINLQKDKDWTFHFFEDKDLLPNDTDTTSRWLSTLLDLGLIDLEEASKQAERIVNNVDKWWIIQTYYSEHQRDRIVDPTAILNILHFLYKVNLDTNRFDKSYHFIQQFIKNKRYQESWRYYFSSWVFLFFLQRLWTLDSKAKSYLQKIIETDLVPIWGIIDRACSIIIKKSLNIDYNSDIWELIKQFDSNDWSYPYDSIYKYWSKDLFFWSKIISTAFAIHAILKK